MSVIEKLPIRRKCSFRFLLVRGDRKPLRVITQDQRRKINIVTGSYDIGCWVNGPQALRELARKHGCSVIIRVKKWRC